MRDILFRGKRLDNGKWIHGFFVEKLDPLIGTPSCFIIVQDASMGMRDSLCTWHAVDPFTIGQSTGLSDQNGKKIFEGDIVECCSEGIRAQGTVQQRKDGMWIIHPAWQKHIMWGLCPDENMHTTVEIIGNIHDNPELLEATT